MMDCFQQYTYRYTFFIMMIIATSSQIVSSQNQEDHTDETKLPEEPTSQSSENGETSSSASAENLDHDSSLHNNETTENNEIQDDKNNSTKETSDSKEPDNAQGEMEDNAAVLTVHDDRNFFGDDVNTPVVGKDGKKTDSKITETNANVKIQDLSNKINPKTEIEKRQPNKHAPCSKGPPKIHGVVNYGNLPEVKSFSKIEKDKDKLKPILNRKDLKHLKTNKKINVKGLDLTKRAKSYKNISTNITKKLNILPIRKSMQHVLKWLYEVLPGNHTIQNGTVPSKDMQTILNWINNHTIPGVHFEMTPKDSTELYDEISVKNSINYNLILNWINGYKAIKENNLHATTKNTEKRFSSYDMKALINWINDQNVPGFHFVDQYDDT